MLPFESESVMCPGDRIIVSHHLSSLSLLSFLFSGQGTTRLFLALPRKVTLPWKVTLPYVFVFMPFVFPLYRCLLFYYLFQLLYFGFEFNLGSLFCLFSKFILFICPFYLEFFRTSWKCGATRGVVKSSLRFCAPTFRLFLLSFLVRLFFLSQRPSWVLLGWSTKH